MIADLVVVGAGLAGSVIAERAARLLGWRVLVIERGPHIAGHAFDGLDKHGVLVHRYGPHVFHTNSPRIWRYLAHFTAWRHYEHRVRARVRNALIPLPPNLESLERLVPKKRAGSYRDALLRQYGFGATVPIHRMRLSHDHRVRALAQIIYDRVFVGYSRKHWGRHPDELDASVTARIPVRLNYDDRYFTDRFQGLPCHGYTSMVSRMLDHPNIEVLLGTDFHDIETGIRYRQLAYTGPIDRFFAFEHGELPYRTVRFVFRHFDRNRLQSCGAITYPNQGRHTRRCEHKILTGQDVTGTTISYEYPRPHRSGMVPYYPIPLPESRARYALYAQMAKNLERVFFCGRLASYQYINMDQVVAQALRTFDRIRGAA